MSQDSPVESCIEHVLELRLKHLTCPPKTGPVTMVELGRRKGEIWLRGDIRRSR